MTKIDDGGAAFPFIEWKSPDGMIGIRREPGMTMRDHFASQAIGAIIRQCAPDLQFQDGVETSEQYFARMAYEVADAMIAARESEAH